MIDPPEPPTLDADAARAAGGVAFENRLKKNLAHLGKWAKREGVTCFRVYDADLPEYAVAVDLYEGRHAVVQEYAAPRSVDPVRAAHRLAQVVALVPPTLGVSASDTHLKVRERAKGGSKYGKFAESGEYHEVREGPARLLVNFTDHLDTGLFLDHRPVRRWLREHARGARFLNLFAYTGVATVQAALGGARSTTTVDMSRTYLDWAQRNLALNLPDHASHDFVQADCLAWLHAARGQWDLIFMDPPAFSNSKRMEGVLDIQRDQATLVDQCLRLLAPGGTLVFSNNLRSFQLDPGLEARYAVTDWSKPSIPPDFARDPKIHRCWFIRHR
jgi:23S rRNA (guanine2445-N2)-methyltransferase / 23S rRNA (guanine2069-N7)-methyltransferase